MQKFSLLISFLTLLIFLVDTVFIQSKKVSRYLGIFYLIILLFVWLNEPFESIAHYLDIGRPVDLLIYTSLLVLIREFFISRQRHHESARQITKLTSEIAILKSKVVTASNEK